MNMNNIFKKNFLTNTQIEDTNNIISDVSMIYNLQTQKVNIKDKVITIAKRIVIYRNKQNMTDPELQILKMGFRNLKIQFEQINLTGDSIFAGDLPLVSIDNHFFNKNQFIDIMIQLYFDQPDNKYLFNNLYIIENCRKSLADALKYFIWVKPSMPHKFRDPYWFFMSPIKKMIHFYKIKALVNYLEFENITDSQSAFEIGRKALTNLSNVYKNNGLSFNLGPNFNQTRFSLNEIVVFFYLNQLFTYTIDSALHQELIKNHRPLVDFYLEFNKNLTEFYNDYVQFNMEEMNSLRPIKLIQNKPSKDDISTLKNAKDTQTDKINNYYYSFVVLASFCFIYKHFK